MTESVEQSVDRSVERVGPGSQYPFSYERTDGRTNEDLSLDVSHQSSPCVTRTPAYPEFQSDPPKPFVLCAEDFFDDLAAGVERQPVIRTGEREVLCWHVRGLVKQRDDYRCRWCADSRQLQVDHIKPWSAGGSHDTRNLQVLCQPHNETKSNRADFITRSRPGVVIDCLRCRDDEEADLLGDLVWCYTCRAFSHDTPNRVDTAQKWLMRHCDDITRPELWLKPGAARAIREVLIGQWFLFTRMGIE